MWPEDLLHLGPLCAEGGAGLQPCITDGLSGGLQPLRYFIKLHASRTVGNSSGLDTRPRRTGFMWM